jgi:hypothetical protein
MEHTEAIRLMAVEKYLMDELTPDVRDSFEEHFFTCQDCAADVRAGAAFLQHSRKLLAAKPETQVMPAPVPSKPGWLAWLRPALAVPVIALLVAIMGYQNFVTYPSLKNSVAELRAPQILPSASLINSNTRGANLPSVSIHSGEPFLLFVDIPSDSHYASYVAELQGPDGKREWSLNVPVQATKDTVPIRVPAGTKAAGQYALIVRGTGSSGEPVEVARYPFVLQLQ